MAPVRATIVDPGVSRLRLQTIVRLRWIAVAGQCLTVILVYTGLGFDLPIGLCMAFIAMSAWLNVFLRIRYPASHRLKSSHAAVMLAYDILQLAALLFLTGGLQNPFSLLMLAPVTVSASTQPPRVTIGLGILTFAVATVLTTFHLPLPWRPAGGLQLPFVYVLGMWAAIVSGSVFMALYAWRIAKEARQMSNALAATEMVLAREQKLSALDGLAAAAAHELATPLSTIAVVAKELMRELPEDSPIREDVALMQTQARRCRDILATLTRRSDEPDLMFSRLSLTHLLDEVAEPHRVLGIEIAVEAAPDDGAEGAARAVPVMLRNPGVLYGLGNLVENAVDFADSRVTVRATWDAARVRVTIGDDGPGLPAPVLEHLGEPYITTRPVDLARTGDGDETIGLGLGYFIAKTLLERSGGKLTIRNREDPESGALVEVVWPRPLLEAPREAPARAAQ